MKRRLAKRSEEVFQGGGRSSGRKCLSPRRSGTTTIVPNASSPASEKGQSPRDFNLDHVDLLFIHTPFAFQPGDEQDPRDAKWQCGIYDKRG